MSAIKTFRRWTPEEDAELRRLHDTGRRLADIAAAFPDRSHPSVQARRIRLCRPRKGIVQAAHLKRAAEMLAKDPCLSGAEIGRAFGLGHVAGGEIRRELGYRALTRREARARQVCAGRRRGATGARLLSLLESGPAKVASLAALVGLTVTGARAALAALRRKGLAFCERGGGKGCPRVWHSLRDWFARNEGLIHHHANKIARRYGVYSREDREDLSGIVRLSFAKAVKTFKPVGVKFGTYASRAAWHDGADWAMARNGRGIRVPEHLLREEGFEMPTVSAFPVSPEDGTPWEPEDRRAESRIDPEFWGRVGAALPPKLAELVIGHYRDGKRYEDLRHITGGTTRENVRQHVEKAKEILRRSVELREMAEVCA